MRKVAPLAPQEPEGPEFKAEVNCSPPKNGDWAGWMAVVPPSMRIKWLKEEDGVFNAIQSRVRPNFLKGTGLEKCVRLPWLEDSVSEVELLEFLGSWESGKRKTFIYEKEFYLTEDVVAAAFGLVKGAPSKVDTQIFKQGLVFKGFKGEPNSNGFLRTQCDDSKLLAVLDFLRATVWFNNAWAEIGKSQAWLGLTLATDKDYCGLMYAKMVEALTAGNLVISAGSSTRLGYHLPILCRYARQVLFWVAETPVNLPPAKGTKVAYELERRDIKEPVDTSLVRRDRMTLSS